MKTVKKVIIAVLIIAILASGAAAGLNYVRKANQKEVMVVDVDSVTGSYYSDETTLDGQITTNVSQNVTLDSDMIIQELYVEKGSQVAVGDPLISFDTTLVEMELNIAKLNKQKQEQDLDKAVNRLNSLKNGGPIEDTDTSYLYNADNLSGTDTVDQNVTGDDEMTPVASAGQTGSGNYLASAAQPFLLMNFYQDDIFSDGSQASDDGGDQDFTSGQDDGLTPTPTPTAEPTPTPVLDDDTDYFDPYFTDGNTDFNDGDPEFYTRLDGDSVPYTGTGTEEDPYVFFCASARGAVKVSGTFLNKMAGYSEDGSRILKEGGYWYQLEFHQNDTVADLSDRKLSCIGYYLIDGSTLEKPVDMLVETEFTLEGASQYEEPEPEPEPEIPDGDTDGNQNVSTMTREQAIKLQQNRINSLKLDIQESELDIAKLEEKVKKKMIYSKLDGTVSYVGDASTGTSDGSAFITVQSKDGFYVKGTVSELMLDKLKEGMTINCMSYSGNAMGSFEAEVVDVADYPVDSSSGFYYGTGNPNVSSYVFSAVVTDRALRFSDMEYVTISLPAEELTDGSFILSREFVRSENGTNYVYKDDNGVLKRQVVSVGGNVNGGYFVLIKGGLSLDDKVAFPYGDDVKEGAKTREVTYNELYGY